MSLCAAEVVADTAGVDGLLRGEWMIARHSAREVRSTVEIGGQQHELMLQGGRLVQPDFQAVNLNEKRRFTCPAGHAPWQRPLRDP